VVVVVVVVVVVAEVVVVVVAAVLAAPAVAVASGVNASLWRDAVAWDITECAFVW